CARPSSGASSGGPASATPRASPPTATSRAGSLSRPRAEPRRAVPGERPVEAADLDLTLAALLAGYALADEVQRRIAAAGFGGLRLAHGFVVQHLVEGPQAVTRLGELMGVTQQAASKAAGDLERLGYVERRPAADDARVRLVSLT